MIEKPLDGELRHAHELKDVERASNELSTLEARERLVRERAARIASRSAAR